jgi:Putative beta-barrel porin 2
MFRHMVRIAILAAGLGLAAGASAQQLSDTQNKTKNYDDTRSILGGKTRPAAAGNSFGIPLGNGVFLSPSINSEVGLDSNPDRTFDAASVGYGILSTSDVLAKVDNGTATTLTAKAAGEALPGTSRVDRYSAGLGLDTYSVLPGGFEYGLGGLYVRDTLSLTRNDTDAVYGEVRLVQPDYEVSLRGRWNGIRYVNDPQSAATLALVNPNLYLNTEFDHDRAEANIGFLTGKTRQVGFYGQAAVASVDYTGQHVPGVVNRDALDIWGLSGFRIAISPVLSADLGWRFNMRELRDDPKVGSYASNYFDAKVIFAPSPRFSMVFDVDRTIGESSTSYGRLSDIVSYRLATNYRLTDRLGLSVSMAQERQDSIADTVVTNLRKLDASLSYDVSQAITAYLTGAFEHTREEVSDQVYDRAKIGLGVNWRLDQPNAALGSTKVGFLPGDPQFADRRLAKLSIGASLLVLPQTAFTMITDALFNVETGRATDHDGRLGGARLDLDLPAVAGMTLSDGRSLLFGVDGFYGRYAGTQTTACKFTTTRDCTFVNLKDYAGENNVGPFGDLVTKTYRGADYWGVGLDARIGRPQQLGCLKDDVPRESAFLPLRMGLSLRGLQQETNLHSVDLSVPDPIDYKDRLDTYYYGAVVGYDPKIRFGQDTTLALNAELGLYYADTLFGADYLAFYPAGGAVYVVDKGHASDRDHRLAAMASLEAELKQQYNWGWLGLTASGEYISYVPKVRYNSQDLDGGVPFDLDGPNKGTSLDGGAAFSYTLGTRATISLQ